MKPTRPRIRETRSRTTHRAASSGTTRPHIRPGRRLRRPRRGTALFAVSALALTAPAAGTATASLGASGPTPVSRAAPGAPCSPAAVSGVQMSEGIPTPPRHVPSTGRLRALNLMIDFSDAPGEGTAKERLAEFFPETADWYRTSSYGALSYEAHAPVRDWLRMPRPFSAYGIDRGVSYEPGYRNLVRDIAKAADSRVDFAAYDLVNILVTPNAGPSALDTVLSVTFAGLQDAPKADGVPLRQMSFVYSRQDDGSTIGLENAYRVLPHENAHALGLPDLYTSNGGGRAGHWDIMSEDWGANNDFLAWHKHKLGWLRAGQVACATGSGSTEHTLTPLARTGGTKLLYVPVSERTGYGIEVRTQGGNDAAVCRPGVLVYWLDTGVGSGDGPVSVKDGNPSSGGCAQQPNINAELTDATFAAGQRMSDRASGVTVEVLRRDTSGNYRVKVTRP
ncbi:M6 family metalloprotease domain-containing protein [Streptomyces sp. NPDC051776]|uniref:M6 family metalloprotease domain-containing protein n=1 Tax=Streptomyces sp. NPDC051776 TaxID=3155414 RepID=UPI0034139F8A